MSEADTQRRRSSRRAATGIITCPSCGGPLKPDAKWCPNCNFTGGDTLRLFPHDPPPLLPILDAVGLLKEHDIHKIEVARENLRRRFPQFRWKICIVTLPRETSLSVFGFWLLNVCPLHDQETPQERAWTILLLLNPSTAQAAVIPGYAAEPFLSDDEWKAILSDMRKPWSLAKPAEDIVRFFKNSRRHLNVAWKRYGTRKSGRKSS
ncbi:MAG: hypothetical protein V4584_07250 [Verrucomicrobiota bacterium]